MFASSGGYRHICGACVAKAASRVKENSMKIKVSEATPLQLDWMVGKIDQPQWTDDDLRWNTYDYCDTGDQDDEPYCPTTDWAQGGPVIEREEISVEREYHTRDNWAAWTPAPIRDEAESFGYGPTHSSQRCGAMWSRSWATKWRCLMNYHPPPSDTNNQWPYHDS